MSCGNNFASSDVDTFKFKHLMKPFRKASPDRNLADPLKQHVMDSIIENGEFNTLASCTRNRLSAEERGSLPVQSPHITLLADSSNGVQAMRAAVLRNTEPVRSRQSMTIPV